MTSKTVYNPTCSGCGKRMGDMSEEEFGALVLAEGLGAKCFDCSAVADLQVPEVMIPEKVGNVIYLDNQEFWVSRNANYELRLRTLSSHAHERRCTPGLSSSTYLNTFPNQNSEREQASENDATCPKCRIGKLIIHADGAICEKCDYWRLPLETITIPSWAITPSSTRGEIRQSTSECPDCSTLRLFGFAPYCDYHLSLLDRNQRDYLYGYGNE